MDYFSIYSKSFSKQLVKNAEYLQNQQVIFQYNLVDNFGTFKILQLKTKQIKLIAESKLRIIEYHYFRKTMIFFGDKPILYRKTMN